MKHIMVQSPAMWPSIFKTLTICIFLTVKFVHADEFKLGLLIPFKHASKLGNYFHRGEYYASAMSIAVEDINKRQDLLPGRNLSFIWNDTMCEELNTLRALVHQLNSGVGAFIGPGCSCKTAARSAAAFNTSMISYVSIFRVYIRLPSPL